MAIQQSINNMLGTIGTVSTLGQHLAEQKKATENAELQKDLEIKDLEYANEKDKVRMAADNLRLANEMDKNPLKNDKGEIITDPKEYRIAQMEQQIEIMDKYKGGKKKEAALAAFNSLQEEMFSRSDLRFNIEKREAQIGILKGGKQ